MNKLQRGIIWAGCSVVLAACGSEISAPTESSGATAVAATANASVVAVSLRVRCERRSSRSKISVDGNNLSPRNGRFSARVRAGGGTVTSATKRAVGDEAEFDFDSNRNDIAQGATRISARFITKRSGPDVVGEILNSQGKVIATRGVECTFR
jgi:hypothetical protein